MVFAQSVNNMQNLPLNFWFNVREVKIYEYNNDCFKEKSLQIL